MLEHAEALLQQYWGYPAFRPGQREIVSQVVDGRDVLAILPTGGGKSITYQVPALLHDGVTLVISPLIALMQDQVLALRARNVPATFINSTLRSGEIDQRWTDAEFGRFKLIYLSPERLHTDMFAARAHRLNIKMIAVDEAHCISEWGHNFRPAYLRIAEARDALPERPQTIAVTATATPEVRRDILEHLRLNRPAVSVKGFDRPNIIWSVFRDVPKRRKVLDVIENVPGTGLLYAATRNSVEAWTQWLQGKGHSVAAYHAGLDQATRETVQAAWLAGEHRLIVATNAFGMGIDKPNVRFVIHVDLPGTLEAYYQEAGRAGRDGKTSYGVLLFQQSDEATQRQLIAASHPEPKALRAVYEAICNLNQVAIGVLPERPLSVNTALVERVTGQPPGAIRTAIEHLERQAIWTVVPPKKNYGLIHFKAGPNAVRAYINRLDNPRLAAFADTLLRTVHAEAFNGWWAIDYKLLTRRLRLPRPRLFKGLDYLHEHGLLDWSAPDDAVSVTLLAPRSQKLPIDPRPVRKSARHAEARLDAMLRYAGSVTCRRHFLLSYFGEASAKRCGKCDICLGRHKEVIVTAAEEPVVRQLLTYIATDTPRAQWSVPDSHAHAVDGLLDWMVQEAYVALANPVRGSLKITDKARDWLGER
ncbi:MAG: ATP-dependent DNA helicase RecQ [Bacteroidota bacterium]